MGTWEIDTLDIVERLIWSIMELVLCGMESLLGKPESRIFRFGIIIQALGAS